MNKLSWDDSLLALSSSKKPGKNILKLYESGIKQIKDLLWILPLRVQKVPLLKDFGHLEDGILFLGQGKIINIKFSPAFGRRGKGRTQLFNATAVVKDLSTEKYINFKWFNAYPGLKKQLESMQNFTFMGEVGLYRGELQIVNPKLNPVIDKSQTFLKNYPTVASVSGVYIEKIIQKIPQSLWDIPISFYPIELAKEMYAEPVNESFKILHGLSNTLDDEAITNAKNRLIYDEFLIDQLKVKARKEKNRKLKAKQFNASADFLWRLKNLFPYQLTQDQEKALKDILLDLGSGHPMMRMIQGDVGCGKTTVALIVAAIVMNQGAQVALMCPTEALAQQHYKTIKSILNDEIQETHPVKILLGSTPSKIKKQIYEELENNEIHFIIGTHALFQESVVFNNLQLAIIDEQHKFGVEQRLKLIQKGKGVHSLIMTATPIPRTLQLAQYGDLDISTIKTIPANRKGIQTRIVTPTTYTKYLSFIKTRISLQEQVYVVVPAISESENVDIQNVDSHLITYKKYFPDMRIKALHGQLKSEEKQTIIEDFTEGKLDILISTSVIEVGINVLNATVMAIYGPERFGLSSLHQLRGRVGRGEKPGFCFLVSDKKLSKESMERLQVLEKNTDGFIIAEADLKNRGEGDLFGVNQSGSSDNKKIANIISHFDIFVDVVKKVEDIYRVKPELFAPLIENLIMDTKISSTI